MDPVLHLQLTSILKSITSKLYKSNFPTFYDGNIKSFVLILARLFTPILWRWQPGVGKCRNCILCKHI